MLALKALPSVERLSSRVIRILGQNPGPYTLQGTNTYLVGTGKGRILIDTGESLEVEDERTEFTKIIEEVLDREEATLDAVVFTHWHLDHTGGLDDVLRLVQSRGDVLPTLHKFGGIRGMAETREGEGESESGDGFGAAASSAAAASTAAATYPEGTPAAAAAAAGLAVQAIKDGDTLKTTGATLRVSHTPGHAWDHLCLWLGQCGSLAVWFRRNSQNHLSVPSSHTTCRGGADHVLRRQRPWPRLDSLRKPRSVHEVASIHAPRH